MAKTKMEYCQVCGKTTRWVMGKKFWVCQGHDWRAERNRWVDQQSPEERSRSTPQSPPKSPRR